MNNRNKVEIYRVKNSKLSGYEKELRKKATKSELLLKSKLTQLGIRFNFQKIYFDENFSCIVDFFFKIHSRKLAIEIDGGYHLKPEQIEKDKRRDKWLLENRRCKVLRVTNEMVENDIDNVILLIAKQFSRVKRFNDLNGIIIKGILDKSKSELPKTKIQKTKKVKIEHHTWISVNDSLPEKYPVIFLNRTGYPTIYQSWYNTDEGYLKTAYTHWIYLPV